MALATWRNKYYRVPEKKRESGWRQNGELQEAWFPLLNYTPYSPAPIKRLVNATDVFAMGIAKCFYDRRRICMTSVD